MLTTGHHFLSGFLLLLLLLLDSAEAGRELSVSVGGLSTDDNA
jgi:hypothetical protein